jgi:predicted ABC-type transport system involved in lysophospholipase L1 biosynthesis ATPase subunit
MVAELLVMSDVSKSYWRGQRLLRVLANVSLHVGRGEIVAVVGSRDEGKTTLLKIAAGIERPDDGRVILAGQDLAELSARARERLLGCELAWIHRERPGVGWRAREYVALPHAMGRERGRRSARRMAHAALERVGADGCAEQRWGELSNWERMLVGFARAYASRPRLILIDDLLDGFGMLRTQEAGSLLRSIVEELGCGVLMSASGMEATLVADSVWSFGRARLVPLTGALDAGAEVIDFPKGVGPGAGSRSMGS